MAIADTINSMKTNITNAYNAIQTKGGTIPTNKNLANLSTAINSISTGGSGGGIEEVSTVAALKAKVKSENIGKFYKYTGNPSSGFETNELYQVVRDTLGVTDSPLMLGLGKVSVNADKYTITYKYTGCGDDFPITNMPLGGIVYANVYTALLGPYAGYVLPYTITVTGCQYTWTLDTSKQTGTLKLYNATGNITVTIIAHPDYGETPTYQGLWNLFGYNNFRGEKNSVNVFDDNGFMSDFISNYSKTSGGATSYWIHFIEDLSDAGDIVRSAVENGKVTDKDFVNIMGSIGNAFDRVCLRVKFTTSSASEFMKSGYMAMKVEFEKNAYTLYLWLVPAKPYAPLD